MKLVPRKATISDIRTHGGHPSFVNTCIFPWPAWVLYSVLRKFLERLRLNAEVGCGPVLHDIQNHIHGCFSIDANGTGASAVVRPAHDGNMLVQIHHPWLSKLQQLAAEKKMIWEENKLMGTSEKYSRNYDDCMQHNGISGVSCRLQQKQDAQEIVSTWRLSRRQTTTAHYIWARWVIHSTAAALYNLLGNQKTTRKWQLQTSIKQTWEICSDQSLN